jgi:hypothetical protein
MTKEARNYLRSLVRQDIRKKERNLAKFTPMPGQSAEEAAEVREKFERDLAFRREVYESL